MWDRAETGLRPSVALDVADPALAELLAEALDRHPALAAARDGLPADLVITDHADPPAAAAVLRLGGPGPLPEDAAPELILAAALLVAAGYAVAPAAPRAAAERPRLSPREREVLALLVDGATDKVIARALGIAPRTAKFHVAAVLQKLGAHNRAEAVGLALREGLIVL